MDLTPSPLPALHKAMKGFMQQSDDLLVCQSQEGHSWHGSRWLLWCHFKGEGRQWLARSYPTLALPGLGRCECLVPPETAQARCTTSCWCIFLLSRGNVECSSGQKTHFFLLGSSPGTLHKSKGTSGKAPGRCQIPRALPRTLSGTAKGISSALSGSIDTLMSRKVH